MFNLALYLFVMLIVSLSILAIPFYRNGLLVSRYYFMLGFFVSLGSIFLYLGVSNPAELNYWLTSGKPRYELLEKFAELGGVEGAIQRIEAKLKIDPLNSEGWYLLGKLYLSKNDTVKAKIALQRAKSLGGVK